MPLTPPNNVPLFSVITDDFSDSTAGNTPVPSPYSDFSETSQSFNDTLVPTSCQDIEDRTLTHEISTSVQEINSESHIDNDLSINRDPVSAISTPCTSISSSTTFSDTDYSEASISKINQRRSRSDKKGLTWVSNVLNMKMNGYLEGENVYVTKG